MGRESQARGFRQRCVRLRRVACYHNAMASPGAQEAERSGAEEAAKAASADSGAATQPRDEELDMDQLWKTPLQDSQEVHDADDFPANWYDSIWKDSFLENPETRLPMQQAIRYWLSNEATLILEVTGTLLLVACFALDTIDNLQEYQKDILGAVEFDVSLYFAALFLGRWYTKNLRISYLFKPFMLIDFFSLLPLAVDDLRIGAFLRIFRILRIARLLQEDELSRLVSLVMGRVVKFKGSQVTALQVFFTLFSVIIITAGVVYELEHTADPESFGNFFDAMYFAIMTLTSVGYGDIVPVTSAGKAVTSAAVLAYAVLIPYELALLAQTMGLMSENGREEQRRMIKAPCSSCGTRKHEADASFCRICGKRLKRADLD